jgi:hypothetical protein
MSTFTEDVSAYLAYLPAVFSGDGTGPGTNFLGRFLLAFEQILTGRGDPEQPGLEEILEGVFDAQGQVRQAGIQRFFDPGPGKPDAERTRDDFLPWLAGWLALSLREDWPPETKRRFISSIAALYQLRGTKAGLEKLISLHTGMGVTIYEFHEPLRVGQPPAPGKPAAPGSTVGVDTFIGGALPHYFLVKLVVQDTLEGPLLSRNLQVARAIIDQEKPAHTYYDLGVESPTMRIGEHSTVGVDTLLGTRG